MHAWSVLCFVFCVLGFSVSLVKASKSGKYFPIVKSANYSSLETCARLRKKSIGTPYERKPRIRFDEVEAAIAAFYSHFIVTCVAMKDLVS